MRAVLVTIGDEILSGNTVDTNSNFIAGELRKIGISVVQIFTIADEVQSIKKTLTEAFALAELVITTGGLGPTKDDRTKTAFKEFFRDEVYLDPDTFAHLRNLMTKRKREHLLEINRSQAEVLTKAMVFQNENGTAPCQMIEENGKMAICLPGVPYEVKPLIKDKIITFLAGTFKLSHFVTRIISVVNVPESLLSQTIENWELALPENLSLSYLPVGNRIKIRLTATGMNRELLETQLNEEVLKLKPLIDKNVISWDGNEIQEILKEILIKEKLTISAAESCTGGEVSRLITSVPGSSQYFIGSLTAYSIQQKIKLLDVSEQTISEKTVVSAEVAQEMSLGAQNLFKTDISVSTTGVAGSASDEYNNQVGTVFYSIRIKKTEKTNRLFLPHLERKDFMNFVSQRVLQDLVTMLTQGNA